jgi:hypothetical protein
MTNLATIVGAAVMFDRPCDRVDLCCVKSRIGKIGPDNTLLCSNCGAPRGRLPQAIVTQLADIVGRYGALDAPIILRAGGRK